MNKEYTVWIPLWKIIGAIVIITLAAVVLVQVVSP
jgi:hypothetical protein